MSPSWPRWSPATGGRVSLSPAPLTKSVAGKAVADDYLFLVLVSIPPIYIPMLTLKSLRLLLRDIWNERNNIFQEKNGVWEKSTCWSTTLRVRPNVGLDRDGRRHWKLGHIVHICILQFVFRKLQFAISSLCTCICGAFGSQISGGEPPPTNSRPGWNVLSFRLMLVLTMSFNISVSQLDVNLWDWWGKIHQWGNGGFCKRSTMCTAALGGERPDVGFTHYSTIVP